MDYYDGNTVTALWNYAQHYALGDNSFSGTYGPSTPGALNLVSGQTHGVVSTDPASATEHPKQTATPDPYTVVSPDAKGVGTVVNDPDPAFDDCSDSDHTSTNALAEMTGQQHRRPAQHRERQLGLVPGRLPPPAPRGTAGRAPTPSAPAPPTPTSAARPPRTTARTTTPFAVLHVDVQPAPPGAAGRSTRSATPAARTTTTT